MGLIRRFLDWWNSRPLGYSELHVRPEYTREQVREIIRTEFAHRLPADPRERGFRIAFLLQDHCLYQGVTCRSDQRPHVQRGRCKPCSPHLEKVK